MSHEPHPGINHASIHHIQPHSIRAINGVNAGIGEPEWVHGIETWYESTCSVLAVVSYTCGQGISYISAVKCSGIGYLLLHCCYHLQWGALLHYPQYLGLSGLFVDTTQTVGLFHSLVHLHLYRYWPSCRICLETILGCTWPWGLFSYKLGNPHERCQCTLDHFLSQLPLKSVCNYQFCTFEIW